MRVLENDKESSSSFPFPFVSILIDNFFSADVSASLFVMQDSLPPKKLIKMSLFTSFLILLLQK